MSNVDGRRSLTPNDVFADFGRRVKNGYDPGRVEKHLRRVADGVSDLVSQINGDETVSESVELVMRATRKSVDEVLNDARGRATEIVRAAESHASTITISAEELATKRREDLESDIAARIDEAESRLAAVEELIARRQTQLREFEAKVEQRVSELRAASDSVRDLTISISLPADSEVIDLVGQGEP